MKREFILLMLRCVWRTWRGSLIPRYYELTKGHIRIELVTKEGYKGLYWIEKPKEV